MRPRVRRSTFRTAGRFSLFGVWLASFALLLQTGLPLLTRPASAESAAASFANDLVLCTAHGLAKASGTAEKAHDDTDRIRPSSCPLCQVWQNLGNAMPASAITLLGPAFAPSRDVRAPDQTALPLHDFDPLHARAPPLTV